MDGLLRLAQARPPVAREAVRRLAVRDREVECLGLAALGSKDILHQWNVFPRTRGLLALQQALPARDGLADVGVHVQRRARVKVAPRAEGLLHGLAAGDVREHAQLELAVVGH